MSDVTQVNPKTSPPVNRLELTIAHKQGDTWPVYAQHRRAGSQISSRIEGELRLPESWEKLLERYARTGDRLAYGRTLGQGLFQDEVDEAMRETLYGEERLRLLLVVDDPELRSLRWELLCARESRSGDWSPLVHNPWVFFSRYVLSESRRRFQIGQKELRTLIAIAGASSDDKFGLQAFDEEALIEVFEQAYQGFDHTILREATLEALLDGLQTREYSVLQIIAHARQAQRSLEPGLFLRDEKDGMAVIKGDSLIKRLGSLTKLPDLAFLVAAGGRENWTKDDVPMNALAYGLVHDLGMPFALALSDAITFRSAEILFREFYKGLRMHGQVDRALSEATVHVAAVEDAVPICALYSRVENSQLLEERPAESAVRLGQPDIVVYNDDMVVGGDGVSGKQTIDTRQLARLRRAMIDSFTYDDLRD
ncbi:MAG: CHAT domain-containing protein, partial [Anaerolineales bacterium]